MSQAATKKPDPKPKPARATKIPANVEAERAVLGAGLLQNDVLDQLLSVLQPEDFWSASHQVIFGAMAEMRADGKPIDVVSLADHLDATWKLNSVQVDGMQGLVYLSHLADTIPAASNVMYYARIVLEKWALRETQAFTRRIGEFITDHSDLEKCLEFFEQGMDAISQRVATLSSNCRNPKPLGEADYRSFLNNRRLFSFAGVAVDQQDLIPQRPDSTRFPSTKWDYVFAAVQERTQAPFAQCAQACLAAITLSVQHLANVEIPGPGGASASRPINNYFVTIARSGERKSGVNRIATEGIEAAQRALELWYVKEEKAYRKKLYEWEVRERAIKGKNGDWDEIGDPPKPIKKPIFLLEDPTADGIFHALQVGQYSQGLFTEEGGTFVGGYGMSAEQRRRTSAIFNKLWDASKLDKPRSSSHEVLRGRRFSMHLIMQPGVSEDLVKDPMLVDNGFTARCLVCEPESLISKRPWREATREAIHITDSFAAAIEHRVQIVPRYDERGEGLAPRTLQLSAEAKPVWIAFHDEIEFALATDYRSIQGFASKAAEHALRLSAALLLFEDPGALEISLQALETGIQLVRYYLAEQLRLQTARPTEQEELAQQLMDWIRNRWSEPFISVPDICKSGPAKVRSKKVAEEIIEICVERGHLALWDRPEEVKGNKRRQVFQIVRDTCDSEME